MELDVFGRMYCSTSSHVGQAVQPMSCACTQEMKNGVEVGWRRLLNAHAFVCIYCNAVCNCKQ